VLAVVATVALAGAAGWVALGGASQKPEPRLPPLPYKKGGITISSVPSGGLGGGETVHGLSGDLLVQNGRIAFVVGG